MMDSLCHHDGLNNTWWFFVQKIVWFGAKDLVISGKMTIFAA